MHCSRGGGGEDGWTGGGEETRGDVLHLCESQDTSTLVNTDTAPSMRGHGLMTLTPRRANHAPAVVTARSSTLPPVRLDFPLRTRERSRGPIFTVSWGTAVCTSPLFWTTHFHKRQSVLQWPDVGERGRKKAGGNQCRAILSPSDENIGQSVRWLYSGQEVAARAHTSSAARAGVRARGGTFSTLQLAARFIQ